MSYKDCKIKKCTLDDIEDIMLLQEQVISGLEDKSLLRENSREMFEACVQEPNTAFGVINETSELVAIAILYDGRGTEEDLSKDLQLQEVQTSANFKLVLVREDYRGRGFQKALMWILEKYAYSKGFTHLCTTVSPDNKYSVSNIKTMGYIYDHSQIKYGGLQRDVYVKDVKSSVKIYNKAVVESVSSMEGLSEERDIILEGVDLNKCIEGDLSFLNTGDILEYIDLDNGKVYYALYMKVFSPMIVAYNREENALKVQDYSERVGSMVLQRALLNTIKGV